MLLLLPLLLILLLLLLLLLRLLLLVLEGEIHRDREIMARVGHGGGSAEGKWIYSSTSIFVSKFPSECSGLIWPFRGPSGPSPRFV